MGKFVFNPFTGDLDQVSSGSNSDITKEATGFFEPENVIVSYDSTTRKVTLTGTVNAYWRDERITVLTSGWVSDAHTATNGGWFLYYDGTNFIWDTSPWTFDKLQIAFVYYSVADKFAIRECHGLMQHQCHKEFHETVGTYRTAGGYLSNYVLNSTLSADRKPYISATTLYDEDLKTINPLHDTTLYTTFALTGASGTPSFVLNYAQIVTVSGNRPYWNEFTGGSWTNTLMSNNYYAALFLMAVPSTSDSESQGYRFVWVQPQAEYSSLSSAEALIPSNLTLGTINGLVPEFVFITKVIIRYQGGNWFIVSVTNLTGNRYSQVGSPAGSYLSTVTTDYSLSGAGTVSNPLKVSDAFKSEVIAYSVALG